MRILQLSSARHFGGGERHLVDLTNGLAKRGHDLFLAVVPDSPLPAQIQNLPDQNVFQLAFANALNVSSAWSLAKYTRDNRIDIIHAHLARDYPLAALAVRRSGDALLIITRHVLFPLGQIHKLTRRRVSRVIAVSDAVESALREQSIFDDRTIRVVRNGVDLSRFAFTERESSQPSALRVGMVGELSPVKGQSDFVRAAALIAAQNPNVQFVIAGKDNSGGDNRRVLDDAIKSLGIENQITIVESDIDVPSFLGTLDVFVSSSRCEAFGLAIVEAMAVGVPVVATRTEGASEILDDERTGLLVPIGDAERLAQKINVLLADQHKREVLAKNARQIAVDRFALTRMIVETEDVYREALSREARPT